MCQPVGGDLHARAMINGLGMYYVVITRTQLDTYVFPDGIEAIGYIDMVHLLFPLGVDCIQTHVYQIPDAQQFKEIKPYGAYSSEVTSRTDFR